MDLERAHYAMKLKEILREDIPENVEDSYEEGRIVLMETHSIAKNRNVSVKIPGWDKFNLATGGLRENEFSILCGGTGIGKTTFLASLVCELISIGVPTYMGSIEIGRNRFMEKMISCISGMQYDEETSKADLEKAYKLSQPVLNSGMYVMSKYDSRVKTEHMLTDLLAAHEKRGIKIAIIDNLNFMLDVTRAQDQLIAMDKAIHDFVIFVKKIPMHIIMVAHPRKTEKGRVESEHDVKGSSTAVQESANVFLLNPSTENCVDNKNLTQIGKELCRELTLAKVRYAGRYRGGKVTFAMRNGENRYAEIG